MGWSIDVVFGAKFCFQWSKYYICFYNYKGSEVSLISRNS